MSFPTSGYHPESVNVHVYGQYADIFDITINLDIPLSFNRAGQYVDTEELVNDIKDLFCAKLRAGLPDRYTIHARYQFEGRTGSVDVSPASDE